MFRGTEIFVRDTEMFEKSSVRETESFFAQTSAKWPRDRRVCSRYRKVRDFEYSSYRECTVFSFVVLPVGG